MELYLKDYLQQCGNDASLAAALALDEAKTGDTLHLGGGTLHFYPQNASQDFYYISNNDYGLKNIAFLIKNKTDFTIDGDGADLIFHGHILPFALHQNNSVTVKNLSVDYEYPMFAQAKITAANSEFVDLQFDQKTFCAKVKNGKFCFYSEQDGWEHISEPLVTEFDPKTCAPTAFQRYYFPISGEIDTSNFLSVIMHKVRLEQLQEGVIRMHGKLPYLHTVGNYWVATHASREYPGFLLTETANTVLENLHLYHTTGMGVVGQLSHNITLKQVIMAPRPGSGRMLSVNADASHFVNCTGTVLLEGCRFVSLMDDCCNIHGNYLRCKQVLNPNTALLTFGHSQQKGVLNLKAGDTVRLFAPEEMNPCASLTVQSAALLRDDLVLLKTEQPLPAEFGPDYLTESYDRMPQVHIKNCEFGANRPRGVLVSTNKKAVVEHCKFYNMNAAVQIGGEVKNWLESGSVEDVLIENNEFCNAAYAGGYVLDFAPRGMKESNTFVHQNITVQNNHFEMNDRRILKAAYCKNLRFVNNTFTHNPALPNQGEQGNGFLTEKLFDCTIEPLKES